MKEKKTMILETERLILREYRPEDYFALYEIFSDPKTMEHYPKPFDARDVRLWIQRNLDRYEKNGFGLWAVVLKETGELIGDCGLTMQLIDNTICPEIGYHIHKKYWRKGYASEAAGAVRDWAFENLPYDTLFCYMKYTNLASINTAKSISMEKVAKFPDPVNSISVVYAISRQQWKVLKESGSSLEEAA